MRPEDWGTCESHPLSHPLFRVKEMVSAGRFPTVLSMKSAPGDQLCKTGHIKRDIGFVTIKVNRFGGANYGT